VDADVILAIAAIPLLRSAKREHTRADLASPEQARGLGATASHKSCQFTPDGLCHGVISRYGSLCPAHPGCSRELRVTMTAIAETANAPADMVTAAPSPTGGLEVVSIAKSYDKRAVLSDISLSVGKGEVLGLLGPNGAGKTTCFYSIMGLVRPDSGRILLDGVDITRLPMYRRAILGLGYLPQETSIFRGLTVEQNIATVLELIEPDRDTRAAELERLLDEFGLVRLRTSAAMALSGGERRRCEIARALAARPSIILLDEPFAGIDPLSISDIRQLVTDLKRRGIGVLITDHNVRETLDIVDRACIIYGGQVLFAGSPEALVADPNVRRLYLGEGFTL
jgi:lipopolysaccharide export system ATP-binding protein